MALYRVPIKWEECGYLVVHASSQEEAAKNAMKELDVYPLNNRPVPGSLKLAFPEDKVTEYIARVADGFENDY